MKIAFVRGPFLNPWEFQTYRPLMRRHSLVAVGARWQLYDRLSSFDGVEIRRPPVWGDWLGPLRPRLFTIWNRGLSWTLGRSFGLRDWDSFTHDIDLIHTVEPYFTMTHQALRIKQRRGAKVVVTVWENLPHMGELHPWRRRRKAKALKEIDGFLAVTEKSRQILLEDGAPPERISVIPMGVNRRVFSPAPKDPALAARYGIDPGDQVVLFMGRLVEEKGVRDLVEAIPSVLAQARSRVRFLFVGAGPLRGLLDAAARRHPGAIHAAPFVPYEETAALHQLADLLVLPSKPALKWREQFGYVLAESMACGKAVVTTRSGSIPEVVGDAALLIEPGDARSLAEALTSILNSEEWRRSLGQKALDRAGRVFDADKNISLIEAFYEKALNR